MADQKPLKPLKPLKPKYGKVFLKDGLWVLSGQPHILARFKRVFPKCKRDDHGTITIHDNDDVRLDLEWFLSRYDLELTPDDQKAILKGAKRHTEMILTLEKMIDPDYKPLDVRMALPARDYQKVAAAITLKKGSLLIADDVGLGKAQPNTSKVLTPDGWRLMGSLKIGDEVIDPDGGWANVTGVYPQGKIRTYRVCFNDGTFAECCDEHLWLLKTHNDRIRGGDRILPLKSFRGKLIDVRGNGNKVTRYFIGLCEPVIFRDQPKLPLHPYLLGALLGDGSFGATTTFSKNDIEIIRKMRKVVPGDVKIVAGSTPGAWRVSRRAISGLNSVTETLRKLGLRGKYSEAKFIPSEYLLGAIEERKALLAGLLDTDGTCTDGKIFFGTSSKELSDQVRDLVGSLGGYSSITSRIPHYRYKGKRLAGLRAYAVNIRLPFNPFTLKRKAGLWKQTYLARGIRKVEYVGKRESTCIRVSSGRSIYLTDHHIVTHNTCTAICMLSAGWTLPVVVVTLAGSMPVQWQEEIAKFMPQLFTHVIKNKTPYELPKRDGRGPDVVILNYHKLSGWDGVLKAYCKSVIFDEAQELRHDDSDKYSAAKNLAEGMKLRCGLSATPIFNFGGEIYNVLNVLTPDALGTKEEFHQEWCYGSYRTDPVVRDPKALGSYLRENFLMLRRTRREVGRELPPLQKIPQHIESDAEALDDIKDSASELARIILSGKPQEQGEVMSAGGQLSVMLRQATGISKAPYIADFIRLLVDSGEKVLCFLFHRAVYDIVLAKLEDLKPAMFTGSETPAEKVEARRKFMAGETPVLLMSLRAGAGIDGLQKVCRTVVFGELDWSPAVMEQNIGRVFRDGQTDPVTAYFLVADDGADPLISEKLGLKRNQAEGIRNPDHEILEDLQVDRGRAMELAKMFALKHGIAIPVSKETAEAGSKEAAEAGLGEKK